MKLPCREAGLSRSLRAGTVVWAVGIVALGLPLAGGARAEVLIPGTGTFGYEFGSYPIPGVGTAALPTFFKGNVVPNMLFSPQQGFPAFNPPDIIPLPPAFSSTAGMPVAGLTVVPPTFDPATGNSAAIVATPFGTAAPGGGFAWLPGTFVAPVSAYPTATVNASEFTGVFTNPAAPNTTLTGFGGGIFGFLPSGSYASISLTGIITNLANGTTISFLGNPVVIAMNVPPFPPNYRANGHDYAQGSSGLGPGGVVQIFATSDPLAFASNPFAGLLELPVPGGIVFFAYGISLGPTIGWSTGAMYGADLTLTITADPGAVIEFVDPRAFNPNAVLPQFGGFATIPEPDSLTLAVLGIVFGLLGRRVAGVRLRPPIGIKFRASRA
jgi:hypothetical protein